MVAAGLVAEGRLEVVDEAQGAVGLVGERLALGVEGAGARRRGRQDLKAVVSKDILVSKHILSRPPYGFGEERGV